MRFVIAAPRPDIARQMEPLRHAAEAAAGSVPGVASVSVAQTAHQAVKKPWFKPGQKSEVAGWHRDLDHVVQKSRFCAIDRPRSPEALPRPRQGPAPKAASLKRVAAGPAFFRAGFFRNLSGHQAFSGAQNAGAG